MLRLLDRFLTWLFRPEWETPEFREALNEWRTPDV